jgi:hypothetical protein
MEMPDAIEAGTEIQVNITIHKGNMTGFARFQQDLPYGFTAESVDPANADFNFQDQKVRLIWLNLPEEQQFTISYKIKANERLSGNIDLEGRFSYIENNERKFIDIQPKALTITPSPNVDPAMIVDVRDYVKTAALVIPSSQATKVACLRQQPVWVQSANAFLVTLLVNKDAVDKLAKIEEKIPFGYIAESVETKGAVFSYTDNVAKFVWNVMPAEPFFTVKYKLVPNEGTKVNPLDMSITGSFSYLEGDKTMIANIVERNEILEGLSQAAVDHILESVVPAAAVVADAGNVVSQPTGQPVKSGQSSVSTSVDNSDILTAETGVYYRLQLAAGHHLINTQQYFKKFNLEYSVLKEQHEGWYKYSIGSFSEYKMARDYRVRIRNSTPLTGAFVTAYDNGRRITVQEALMSLNQKWYQ